MGDDTSRRAVSASRLIEKDDIRCYPIFMALRQRVVNQAPRCAHYGFSIPWMVIYAAHQYIENKQDYYIQHEQQGSSVERLYKQLGWEVPEEDAERFETNA